MIGRAGHERAMDLQPDENISRDRTGFPIRLN